MLRSWSPINQISSLAQSFILDCHTFKCWFSQSGVEQHPGGEGDGGGEGGGGSSYLHAIHNRGVVVRVSLCPVSGWTGGVSQLDHVPCQMSAVLASVPLSDL